MFGTFSTLRRRSKKASQPVNPMNSPGVLGAPGMHLQVPMAWQAAEMQAMTGLMSSPPALMPGMASSPAFTPAAMAPPGVLAQQQGVLAHPPSIAQALSAWGGGGAVSAANATK